MSKDKMQITHEEARKLIHLDSDETLKAHQKELLDSHLALCTECRKYAESIQKMEAILQPLLNKQWMQQPIPLSIGALLSRSNYSPSGSILLATRMAAIAIMFAVFMFSAWQFSFLKSGTANPALPSIPPVPISSASTKIIGTNTQSKTCEELSYLVQRNDTLASIAYRFSTSKKEIMIANNMKSEMVIKGMKVIIPVCNFTPTGTANGSTITFTPMFHTITSTPGG